MLHVSFRVRAVALAGAIAVAALAGAGLAARPHAPSTANAVTLTQASAPDNDDFNRPWFFTPPISPPWQASLPFDGTQDTRGATLEPGEGAPCASISSSLWYKLQAETNGRIEIDTIGSDYDTVLAVYTYDPNGDFIPSPPGSNLLALDCNDNASGAQSRVRFDITQYSEYFVQVGAVGAPGTMRIHAQCSPACPPRNDNRESAEYIDVSVYQPVYASRTDTTAATMQPGEPRSCGNTGATVWYQVYTQSAHPFIIDTAGSDFGTVIAVYEEGGFEIPSPPDGFRQLACADGGVSGRARLRFDGQQYRSYWIQVGGHDGATGDLRLSVSCDGPCPPFNDSFQSWYGGLPYQEELPSTAGATVEEAERTDCGDMGHTVWYAVYAEGPTTIEIDTEGSGFDTAIAVYEDPQYLGGIQNLERISCERGGAGQRASVRIPVEGQRQYFVQVGGRNGASGLLAVKGDCDPSPCPPAFDSQMNPNWITAPAYLPWYDYSDTRGATEEPGEPLSCGDMGNTVWYVIEGSGTGTVRVSTKDSSFATALALYRADDFFPVSGERDRVACADGSTQPAELTFDIKPGERYRVQLGGRNGASGDLQILIDCVPACPPQNDGMGNGMYISGTASGVIDTRGATLDPGEPQPCGGARNVGKTVWFWIGETLLSTDGPQTATWRVTTTGSDFPAIVAVYAGDGFSPPGGATESACGEGAATFEAQRGRAMFVQIGGANDSGGQLQFQFECSGACPDRYPGGQPGTGGSIVGPDTGNGGYLGRDAGE